VIWKLELSPLLGECFGLTANVCPLDRKIQYRTRLFTGLKQTQCGEHDAALQIATKGRAKVMTHRPGKKQCTRNFDCLRDVACYSDGNRGDTARFNGSLDQSDGLMTDRSSGRQ
jgi:hypothetical protein